ncbi:replication protein [Halalkalibacterium halodurans]|uniref:replication protein n=1 Tax=Halalkalibacterium halodurans TaxID=86665 RepID=UPI002E1D09F6|nr:replication protein [Halalkalibacterium halodurans]MED4124056.1 replication protein [Halalkalibacterium halodurans]
MANPQTEHGHTRIANEILEHCMKLSLNGTQFRLIMLIWRYTYGFRRKEHEFSINFMAEHIEGARKQVDRELQTLIDRNIITLSGYGKRGARVLSFNKNYDTWDQPAQTPPPKVEEKEKTKPKSNKKPKYSEDNMYYKMAVHFHKLVSQVAKEVNLEHLIKKANLQSWADDFRKLWEVDKVQDKKQILTLMEWVTQHDFWKKNVLSAKKFRQKYLELAIAMQSEQSKTPKQSPRQQASNKEIEFQKYVAAGGDPDEFDWGE